MRLRVRRITPPAGPLLWVVEQKGWFWWKPITGVCRTEQEAQDILEALQQQAALDTRCS